MNSDLAGGTRLGKSGRASFRIITITSATGTIQVSRRLEFLTIWKAGREATGKPATWGAVNRPENQTSMPGKATKILRRR